MSYSDVEVLFIITGLDGPLDGHDGLTVTFSHREESVALLLVHHGHGVPRGMTVLMEKKTHVSDRRKPDVGLILSYVCS